MQLLTGKQELPLSFNMQCVCMLGIFIPNQPQGLEVWKSMSRVTFFPWFSPNIWQERKCNLKDLKSRSVSLFLLPSVSHNYFCGNAQSNLLTDPREYCLGSCINLCLPLTIFFVHILVHSLWTMLCSSSFFQTHTVQESIHRSFWN